MTQKKQLAQKPKQSQLPHRVQRNNKERQDDKDKRPFSQSLPALMQQAPDPQAMTPTEAAQLQRTVGNQALGRAMRIQPKLTLGPVNDKYEQEADATATQVVGHISSSDQISQRQEEEELQMKPLPSISTVQRQEEAEEVQMMPALGLQRQEEEEAEEIQLQRQEDEEEVQMMPALSLQRQEEEAEEIQLQRQEDEEEVQAKAADTTAGGELSTNLENSIQNEKGGGQPLAPATRANMENAFGADFGNVRVHTGGQSDQINRSIQARAFTTGQDIFFRQGEYNPESSGGQELLAHELTHTIQQTGGQAQRQPVVQRSLIKTKDFMTSASISKKKTSGDMSDLIHALDKYQVQEAFLTLHPSESLYTNVLSLLDNVELKAQKWQTSTGSSLGFKRNFKKGARKRHKSKKTAVASLLEEINTERALLTNQKKNLGIQQMLTALDETEARPDMSTSYLEQPLKESNADVLLSKLELSQKVITRQVEQLIERQANEETLSEEEITAVGKGLQGLNVVAGQLFSIAGFQNEETTLTGKFEPSLKGALDAQVPDSDPKKLYTYTHIGDEQGPNLEAKAITAEIHTATRKYLDENGQTGTEVNTYIGNTNDGRLIREAQMWLANPVIKQLYDLYIKESPDFEKMEGLIKEESVSRLLNIVMAVPQISLKAQALPGAEGAFGISGATFY